jgi:hypothetical protein
MDISKYPLFQNSQFTTMRYYQPKSHHHQHHHLVAAHHRPRPYSDPNLVDPHILRGGRVTRIACKCGSLSPELCPLWDAVSF